MHKMHEMHEMLAPLEGKPYPAHTKVMIIVTRWEKPSLWRWLLLRQDPVAHYTAFPRYNWGIASEEFKRGVRESTADAGGVWVEPDTR